MTLKRLLVVAAVAFAVVVPRPRPVSAQAPAPVFPGASWDRVENPTAAGYCSDKLDLVTERLKTLPTSAVTVIVGGRVLYDYGPQDTVSYLASVRKSLLAMMYGTPVARGRIRLDATLTDLGIDDVGGLLPIEKTATVADLLAARSGVYHEAANAACTGCGSTAGDPPGPRGSVKPGTYFLYNNWDFNALGTIYEQQTGDDIYQAFARDFAGPMQFQDFRIEAQRKSRRPRVSIHPAYHFYLSTRDMARVGYLMLRGGDWAGKTIVPHDWIARITHVVTPVAEMHPDELQKGPFGYGNLWWIWDGPANTGPYQGAYTGIGAIGQFITVLPALDMVVAHKTVPRGSQAVTRPEYLGLLDLITGARCSAAGRF